jgi:hypothetical protein
MPSAARGSRARAASSTSSLSEREDLHAHSLLAEHYSVDRDFLAANERIATAKSSDGIESARQKPFRFI